jgi:hypothetical protein
MSRIAILAAVALALSGCRTDPNVPILERELRLQEDKIYELEAQLAESRAALESVRGAPTPARPGLAGPERPGPFRDRAPAKDAPPALPPGIAPEPVVAEPPIVELPGGAQAEMPESLKKSKEAPPLKEAPSPKEAPLKLEEVAPPSLREPAPLAPPAKPAGTPTGRTWQKSSPVGESVEHLRPAGAEGGRVERVLLNPALTGGLNADGKPGDEGVAVFIEPQDARGRSMTRPGAVSVVVLDRHARGDAARVARWDFTSEQVAQRMRRTSVGSGIYLELPWPAQAPAHSELQVFVRYAADETRQLEAEMPVSIELPGQPRQWTAAPPGARKAIAPPVPAPASSSASPAVAVAPRKVEPPKPAATPAPPHERPRSEARRPVWSPTR